MAHVIRVDDTKEQYNECTSDNKTLYERMCEFSVGRTEDSENTKKTTIQGENING